MRAGVLQSVDLATAERSDHRAVIGEVRAPRRTAKTDKSGEPKVSEEIPPLNVDVNKTKEAWRVEGFAAKLQQSYDESHRWLTEGAAEWKSPLGIDERISKWMAETRRLAAAWFPRERAQPRKKWLSEEAWTTVGQIAPMRRRQLAEGQGLRNIVAHVVFDGWTLLCRGGGEKDGGAADGCSHVKHHDGAAQDRAIQDKSGEERARRISTARAKLCMATFAEARSTAALGRLQRASRLTVRRDRLRHYEQKAGEAAKACARGDTKEMHAIARILAGAPPRQGGSVKDEAGKSLTCPSNTRPEASWCKQRLHTRLLQKDTLNVTLEEVEDLIKKLPRGKGRGPDQSAACVVEGPWQRTC